MKVVRINRMMLGVSMPVAAFCDKVFGHSCVDVDDPQQTLGCDVLIVGRQQLHDTGVYSFAHDVIPRCLKVHRPALLVAVIPDRFDAARYAKDVAAWNEACASGVAVVVFELGALRELKETGRDDTRLVALAQATNSEAATQKRPLAWLNATPLGDPA